MQPGDRRGVCQDIAVVMEEEVRNLCGPRGSGSAGPAEEVVVRGLRVAALAEGEAAALRGFTGGGEDEVLPVAAVGIVAGGVLHHREEDRCVGAPGRWWPWTRMEPGGRDLAGPRRGELSGHRRLGTLRRRALFALGAAFIGWVAVANNLPAAQAPSADWSRPRMVKTSGITALYPRAWHASMEYNTLLIWSGGDPKHRSADFANHIPDGAVWI